MNDGILTIEVRGGCVVDVRNYPPDTEYQIIDWDICSDCGGVDPNCSTCSEPPGRLNIPDKILSLLRKNPGTILSWKLIYERCWDDKFDETRMATLYANTSTARALPGGHGIKSKSRVGLYYEAIT